MFRSRPSTAASAFTLSNLYHYGALQNTIGLGSTVTNQIGFVADATIIGATNNYGFQSNIASGSGRWNFYAGGTAANYMAGTLEVGSTIGVGDATPAASGAGITFPASASASSDANTLDDYEEGTFTPTLSSGFSVAPTSYTEQSGRYTKIGRLVYVEIALDPNGATGNASRIRFGGLPFTSAASAPWSGGVIASQVSFNTNAGDVLLVQGSNTTIDFYTNDNNERLGNAANVNINSTIRICATYVV
jgi:hypothetical protein